MPASRLRRGLFAASLLLAAHAASGLDSALRLQVEEYMHVMDAQPLGPNEDITAKKERAMRAARTLHPLRTTVPRCARENLWFTCLQVLPPSIALLYTFGLIP